MKETRNLLNSLVLCGVTLAMVSTLAAQTADQGVAKVVWLKGEARFSTGGNNDWQLLKAGDVVKPGMLIQTASGSKLDIVLGDGSAPVAQAASVSTISYRPTTEQNVVRIWENTLLGVDKLIKTHTGADLVTETLLNLKAGHITGTVKKMSAASKYEVKIPSGVASIRGTVYDLTAEGVLKILSGSGVMAYPGPDGTPLTQVVNEMQQFDAHTGVLTALPEFDRVGLRTIVNQLLSGLSPVLTPVAADKTLLYVSPH